MITIKKYYSYSLLRHLVYVLILLCICTFSIFAKPQYVFQFENPIANFACNENDTSRYEGHYRFENAYRLIEDMLEDKRPLDFAEAVFAVENCMYDGKSCCIKEGNLIHTTCVAESNKIACCVLLLL